MEGLKLAPESPGASAEAALAFAMAGDSARAESLAQDMRKRFPLDTQIKSLWLPAIQAQLALNRKDPTLALNILQVISPVELAQFQFLANLSCLYPTYIRGEVYLAGGQGLLRPPSSRELLTTTASSGTAGRDHWPGWAWPVQRPCWSGTRRVRPGMPMPAEFRPAITKTSSSSGKTPTRTFLSTNMRRPSTPICSSWQAKSLRVAVWPILRAVL